MLTDIALPRIERGGNVFEVAINFGDLTVNVNEVGLSLGYGYGKIPSHFEEMIGNVLLQTPQHCKIKAGYRIIDVKKHEDRNDGLYLAGTFFKMQRIVTAQLRKAEKAALFICTLGNAMESWATHLSGKGDLTLSYIVDTVASVTVENATDMLHDHIEQQMRASGLNITNRYSPGYCDWSVSEQHLLFSFLPENFCGITLTESALMVPMKSISGIIGIGAAVKRVNYSCDSCGMKDCTYRAYRLARTEYINHKK